MELIGLLRSGSSLRGEMIAMEASGVRGWLNDRTGNVLVLSDFEQSEIRAQVTLHGLLARLLMHQHRPPVIGTLGDDERLARWALYEAIAEGVEAGLRAANAEAFRVPTAEQTERSATILDLALPLHQIANLPLEGGQARVFLEARIETGARALTELILDPPRSTLELLGGDASSIKTPRLPDLGQLQLQESVGAFLVQVLLEYLDDFERARTLALLWRGDRYHLYTDEWGDNLVWICHWHSPEAAARAGEILQPRSPAPEDPAGGRRSLFLAVDQTRTIFANCASAEGAAQVRAALAIPSSRSAPAP